MNTWRAMSPIVLLPVFGLAAGESQKENKGPKITEKTFRQTNSLLMGDPLSGSSRNWSRLIMLYALEPQNAEIVFGREELHWTGVDKSDPHALLLLSAYAAGNIQSQLNSGVKRNDRYSGLIALFRVYRALRSQDEKYQIAAVDEMLTLHEENKLVSHLQKLEEKKPEKMTPAVEAAIRRLIRTR